MSVGSGKTLVGYKYINRFYSKRPRVLVAVPNLPIINEAWIPEYKKWKCEHLFKLIKFTTYLSLHKESYNYDLLILDEVHSLLYTHDKWLSGWKGRILGLTGTTPPNPSSEKGKMMAKYCPVVYTYKIDEGVKDGILNDYKVVVHYIELSTVDDIEVRYKDKETGQEKSFFTSEAKSYKYSTKRIGKCGADAKKRKEASIFRMRALMDFKSKEKYAKKLFDSERDKCILFANTKEQAARLGSYTYFSGNEHSERNIRHFQEGKIMKLVAIHQLSQGVNIRGLKTGIILYVYGKESAKFLQRFGRLVRLPPDEVATCHILIYKDTVEENHLEDALKKINAGKVSYK